MTVYIYSGPGSSPTNIKILHHAFSEALYPFGISVKIIGPDDINTSNAPWQSDGELLVVGGGQFTPMKEKLTPYGYQAIQDFAARKTYLGICKGGYAGAKQIEFISQKEIKTSPGFGFFNGVAKGSLPLAPELFTGNNDSASIQTFYHHKHGREFPALYWGGPAFVMPDSDVENIECLVSLKGPANTNYAMGIKMPVDDQGKAILVGYHSEAIRSFLGEWVGKFSAGEVHDERLHHEMAQFKPWQYYFGFAALLDDLEIVKDHSFVDLILDHKNYDPATFRRRPQSAPLQLENL